VFTINAIYKLIFNLKFDIKIFMKIKFRKIIFILIIVIIIYFNYSSIIKVVICGHIKDIMQLINSILINESFFKIRDEMLRKK